MQHISIYLAKADNSPLKSYSGLGQRISDLVRMYVDLHAENGYYMFVPDHEYVLGIELVFANKADAEKISKEFDKVPKWLEDAELKPGFFAGKPICVLWNDEKN